MKKTASLATTLLVGFAAGASVISTLLAQGAQKPAYIISDIEVTDQAAFAVYVAKALQRTGHRPR